MSGGGRHRLGESALDRVGMVWGRETPTGQEPIKSESGVVDEDTDWERAHLRVEGNE